MCAPRASGCAWTGKGLFLTHTWKTLARVIAETGVNADLFKAPETVPKTVKRRVSAELKRFGVLLRRLIFLMTFRVELAPVTPRPGSNHFEKAEGETQSKYTFSLVPTQADETPDFLRGPVTVPEREPSLAASLIARWQAMLDTLKHANRRAKCLARTIQRRKANGEPKPYIVLVPGTHAMHRAVAFVSGGLTVQLIEALRDWPVPNRG
ncbi:MULTISPECIES: hypothetical protein [unclassified Hyphomonas]|uniref:hypothetical protein n=1 Tax=unclassified Hyphomonas TaxID=2630699 RepID=UPI000458AD8E|nr:MULTISPECIES: hypothetical protein [unclassified Hyphomonas]KCZ46055.1 hypothetical protein HY17_09870 [Hyphomonas sp. CY54-11-8]